MVSKTKRALALVLTAMMAASALAGCGPNNGGGTQNSAASANEGGTASQAAVQERSN